MQPTAGRKRANSQRSRRRAQTSAGSRQLVAHAPVPTWPTMTTGRWLSRRFCSPAVPQWAYGPELPSYFVRTGEIGVVVDRLPPGRQCAESAEDVLALAVFMEPIEKAQAMDRHSLRDRAVEEFNTDLILDTVIESLDNARLAEITARSGPIR